MLYLIQISTIIYLQKKVFKMLKIFNSFNILIIIFIQMIKRFFLRKIKNNSLKIFLIFFLSLLWLAIGTDFNTFKSIFSNINFETLVDALRFSLPYFFFFVYLILYKRLNFLTKNKYLNFILLGLLINFFIQSISLVVVGGNLNYLHFFFLIFFSFIILIHAYNLNYENEVLIITGIFILFYSSVYSIIAYHSFVFKTPHLNLYGNIQNIESYWEIISDNSPRSSGLSRIALIITVPLMLIILTTNRSSVAIFFLYYFHTNIILLAQSRINTSVFYLFLTSILIFAIFSGKSFKTIIKKIILIIIFPILIHQGTIHVKKEYSKSYSEFRSNFQGELDETGAVRIKHPTSPLTSGRLEDWKKIIQKNNNLIFGNGFMGDRFLINQSASNILIYNYASGGIISVVIFILLILRSIFIFVKVLFVYKILPNKNNLLIMSTIFIQSYLILRGVAESTFAIFGIDFLIFFSLYFFSEKYYSKARLAKKSFNK